MFASTKARLRIWLTAPDDLLCVAALSMAHVAASIDNFDDAFDSLLPLGAAGGSVVSGFGELRQLVRRAFQLSRTLPDPLLREFGRRTSGPPRTTLALCLCRLVGRSPSAGAAGAHLPP